VCELIVLEVELKPLARLAGHKDDTLSVGFLGLLEVHDVFLLVLAEIYLVLLLLELLLLWCILTVGLAHDN
jgi:hypothetical protein